MLRRSVRVSFQATGLPLTVNMAPRTQEPDPPYSHNIRHRLPLTKQKWGPLVITDSIMAHRVRAHGRATLNHRPRANRVANPVRSPPPIDRTTIPPHVESGASHANAESNLDSHIHAGHWERYGFQPSGFLPR